VIMNVVTKSKKTIPKIKTFASDLDANRRLKHVPKKVTPALTYDDLNKENNQLLNNRTILPPTKKMDGLVKNNNHLPINSPKKSAPLPKIIPPPIKNSLTTATDKAIASISDKKYGHDQSYDAVIITDTKHNRFRLMTEIKKALQVWWEKKVANYAENKKPKYTVPHAERRKGIIQKATSTTGRAVSVDHDAVLERIKASKLSVLPKSSITDQDNKYSVLQNTLNGEEEATWSKIAETGIDLNQDIVSSEEKTMKPPKKTIVPVAPIIPATPTIPLVEENKKMEDGGETKIEMGLHHDVQVSLPRIKEPSFNKPTVIPEVRTVPAKIITPKIPVIPIIPVASIVPIASAKTIKPKETIVPVAPIIPATPTIPLVEENKNNDTEIILANNLQNEKKTDQLIVPQIKIVKSNLNKIGNNHLTSRLMALLRDLLPLKNIKLFVLTTLILTLIGFIIYVGINTLRATPTTSQTKDNYSSALFNTAVQYHDILTGKDKSSIFAQIQTRNNTTESVTEINFILPQGNEIITAPALLPLFGFNLAPDFVSSLGQVTFGFYHNEPWLVITTNNRITAQGGLLQWETNMISDLNPLFGSATTARLTNISSLTGFKDSLINNLDVRILFDNDKKEKLVYGFMSSDYILITTNTMAWLNLSINFNQPQ